MTYLPSFGFGGTTPALTVDTLVANKAASFRGDFPAGTTTASTFASKGVTLGWNLSGAGGEMDLMLGREAGGTGGLAIYSVGGNGLLDSAAPILTLDRQGNLALAGNLRRKAAADLDLASFIQPGDPDATAGLLRAIAVATSVPFGAVLTVPAGRFYLSASIAVVLRNNNSLTIRGAGAAMSELAWTSDTDGFQVTLDSGGAWLRNAVGGTAPAPTAASFRIDGVSLLRAFDSEGRTAVTITGTAPVNPGSHQVYLDSLEIHGTSVANPPTPYQGLAQWLTGVSATAISGLFLTDVHYHCAHQAGGTGRAVSVDSTSAYVMTGIHLTRCDIFGVATGLQVGQNVQGITLTDSSFVGCQYGIDAGVANGVVGDLIGCHNTHFDFRQNAIRARNFDSIVMTGCYILANDPAIGNGTIAVDLTDSCRNSFIGNSYLGAGGTTGQSFLRVNNTSNNRDTQVCASVIGNSFTTLTGPLVQFAGFAHRGQVACNAVITQGAGGNLGTDARGSSTWSNNTLNGAVVGGKLDTLAVRSLATTTQTNAGVLNIGGGFAPGTTTTSTFLGSGLQIGWNLSGGGGETDLLLGRGLGAGGLRLYSVGSTGALDQATPILTVGGDGSLTLAPASITRLSNQTDIGASGSTLGSNVIFNDGFRYVASDYGWYLRADGATGVSLNVGANGTAGSPFTPVQAWSAAPNGVMNIPQAAIGNGTINAASVTISGNPVMAAYSKAGAPTAANLPAGQAAVFKDTAGGGVKLYYNDGGSLRSVALA